MRKANRWIALLLVLALAAVLAGCGSAPGPVANQSTAPAESVAQPTDNGGSPSPAAAKHIKIGFSLPSLNFPFYVRMHDTLIAACEKNGWEYQFVDGNLDSATQLSGCNDLISNKDIDILVMATWWIDAMQDVLDQCAQRGIQVYLMDRLEIPEVAKEAVTFRNGCDNYNAGWVGGTWAAGYLSGQGKTTLNMVTMRSNDEIPLKRCNGFVDALKANGIQVTVLQDYAAGERPKAMNAMEDALVAYKNVDLVFGASAQDSLGAYDACVAANRSEVLVIGFDGEADEIKLIDQKGQYLGTITQDPVAMANMVAQKIQEHFIDGKAIDQVVEIPAGVYCAQGQLDGSAILKDKPAPSTSAS